MCRLIYELSSILAAAKLKCVPNEKSTKGSSTASSSPKTKRTTKTTVFVTQRVNRDPEYLHKLNQTLTTN